MPNVFPLVAGNGAQPLGISAAQAGNSLRRVWEFFDLLGSKVLTTELAKNQRKIVLDVSHLPNGTYVYKLISDAGFYNVSGKFLIFR